MKHFRAIAVICLFAFGQVMFGPGMGRAAAEGKGRTFYVDASGGSDANDGMSPASAWRTLGRVNAGAFAPGDSVLFKRGEAWRGALKFPSSGSPSAPITIGAYGVGERPILKGSRASDEDGCQWVRSSRGTNEYYLLKNGGDPGYHMPGDDEYKPGWLWYKDGPTRLLKGAAGSLEDGQWGWGDNDWLGFPAIYVRSDAGTPAPVEIPQGVGVVSILDKSYLEIRDLAVYFANLGMGMTIFEASHHITVENCEIAYNLRGGIGVHGDYYNDFDCHVVLRGCVVHDLGGHGIAASGEEQISDGQGNVVVPVRKLRRLTIENCEVYNVVRSYFFDSDGYGLKFVFVDDSRIIGCLSYNNASSGLNLDGNRFGWEGVEVPPEYLTGCDGNEIAYNIVHHNRVGINLEVSSNNLIHHNLVYGNDPDYWPSGMVCLWHSQGNSIYYNVVYGNS